MTTLFPRTDVGPENRPVRSEIRSLTADPPVEPQGVNPLMDSSELSSLGDSGQIEQECILQCHAFVALESPGGSAMS